MKKMLKCIGIILITGLSFPVLGTEKSRDWVWSCDITFSFFDVKEMNAMFEKHSIEELPTHQYCGSFEFGGVKKGLNLASWMFLKLDRTKSESLKIWANHMMVFWKARYLLPITDNLSLFISPGLGGYHNELNLIPTSLAEADFDSLLTGPGARRTCRIRDIGISLCVEVGLLFTPFKGYFKGLNIKGGYIFSPIRTGWELEDGKPLKGAPNLNLSSPYISLGLVFGGREIKEE